MSYFNKGGKYEDKPVSLKSIREHRLAKGGMSQLELSQATHLRVPQGLISELERGTRKLTSWTAPLIADVFEVGVEDLILGNNLALAGVKQEDRLTVLKTALENPDLISAGKSISKLKDLALDFGDRDSWGRKLDPKEVEKRAEKDKDLEVDEFDRDAFGRRIPEKEAKLRRKEAKKKREDLDFGDRDSFGRKIVKKTAEVEKDDDTTMLEFFEKDESTFEERLKALLLKGEKRKGLE